MKRRLREPLHHVREGTCPYCYTEMNLIGDKPARKYIWRVYQCPNCKTQTGHNKGEKAK